MENLLFLGVPILKHFRVNQQLKISITISLLMWQICPGVPDTSYEILSCSIFYSGSLCLKTDNSICPHFQCILAGNYQLYYVKSLLFVSKCKDIMVSNTTALFIAIKTVKTE